MSDPRIGRGSGGVPYRIPTADPTSIQRPGTEPTTDVWGGRAHKIGKLAANFGRGALDALGADLPEALRLLTTLHDRTDEPKPGEAMLAGRGVSPGVGSGPVISSPAEAAELRAAGRPYVYALDHVSSANVEAAVGASALVVLDRKKNNASRAVASIGKPVVALPHAAFDRAKQATDVTVDGTRGLVRFGALPTIAGGANEAARATLGRLRVAAGANVVAEASTPATVRQAVALGATDVRVDADALLTTDAVLTPLRRYLLETEAAPRLELIEQIVAEVRANAEALVEAAGDATLTFAIGSRSPKSFFPVRPELLDRVADEIGLPAAVVQERVADLGSGNSKLGLRGGRLGVKFPDLFAGIGRAVFEAVADAKEDGHASGNVKLLVPAVSLPGEIDTLKKKLEGEREAVQADFGVELDVKYGAGIETAAGALQMAEISAIADFAEYGLAEMTETVMGISREDADSFVPHLVESGVYPADPFERPAFDLLDKLIAVSQYVAGDTPNSFPATVRGAMTVDPNGMMLARQAGVRDVVVPRDLYVDGLIEAARTTHALEQVFGANLGRTKPSDRDTAAKTFKLLETRLAPMSGEVGGKIPEGVTALEHVERLIRQESRGNLSKADALLSLDADIVDSLRRPVIDPRAQIKVLSKGAGASPGCGVGKLALSHDAAEAFAAKGEPYVLLVNEVHAEDVPAVRDAEALVSVRGGVTSHSAMIAANSDVPCVMDDKAKINLEKRTAQLGRTMVKEGDWISVDGTKGQVIAGEAPLIDPAASPAYATLMQWADELRTLEVHANADTPAEAKLAFESGAEGVGLVRSEHMFFGENRLLAFRSAIVGDGAKAEAALEDMEAFQRADFEGLFTAAAGKKVAVRLLDPPLYEFLPNSPDGIRELAKRLDLSTEEVVRRIDDAQEVDSLMGLRGARLAEVRPDIEATQVRALAKAFAATKANGIDPKQLYITVPMVNTGREMEAAAARIKALVAEVEAETGQKIPVQVGAMIETPAAALEAGRIAQHSDYRSYGTNDLTQLTLGFGRNVAPKFIPELIANGALAADPSKMLDPDTVGKMMRVAEFGATDAVGEQPSGICGAQGSDPSSVRLVQQLGLTYVSVPPAQVPKARFAAAQASALAAKGAKNEGAISGAFADLEPKAGALAEQLSRGIRAVTKLPIPVELENVKSQLALALRNAAPTMRELAGCDDAVRQEKHLPLFDLVERARAMLDADKLIGGLRGETKALEQHESPKLKLGLHAAHAAIDKLAEGASERLASGKTTSRNEREVASFAWTALRALESARDKLEDAGIPVSQHAFDTRLRHVNDGWDNPHYTQEKVDPSSTMGAYLKKAAASFLEDNGLSVRLEGQQNLPEDRKVVFALTHRSGAIDRFVAMSALPVGDDDFMYIVRGGSPLDVRAQEAFGPDNGAIITADTLVVTAAKVHDGFKDGKNFLITYPEGTGTIQGEPRYVAAGTTLIAQNTGAVVVPVTLQDTHDVRPFDGGEVVARLRKPIDPKRIGEQLGEDSDGRAALVMRALLQHHLGSPYAI